jgi:hypothetical protein
MPGYVATTGAAMPIADCRALLRLAAFRVASGNLDFTPAHGEPDAAAGLAERGSSHQTRVARQHGMTAD